MRHIIVFLYVFTILIGASALTIQWLASKGDKEKNFVSMKPFVIMLLFMNVYDFLIYYCDNIIKIDTYMFLSIGDCFIAILVLLWLRVSNSITGTEVKNRCIGITEKYVILYGIVWLAAIILFRELYWIRLVIDIPLIGLLIAGSAESIYSSVRENAPKRFVAYKVVIAFFMTVNYVSYFISESGFVDRAEAPIMNITIYYWMVINIANMMLLYKRDFRSSYTAETPVVLDLSEALANVQKKYELTKREVEILEEIYSGKTNTQIAEALFISESTVKAHIYNIFRKLDVKSRVEAVCIVREEKEQKV
ncbi:response regulator transcription factor [Ihubacter sp. rT4E-8]|uniref:response regulator transcription factor n=1 Tax=Ihubacter sp. rT4E-8 TaxID=3242369 RepID=UPI003CE86700